MLGLANVSPMLLTVVLAGNPASAHPPDEARSNDEAREAISEGAVDPASEAEDLSDEELAELERWELRVLQHPYDLAGFYRSGGSRGLYDQPSHGRSLSSFYRSDTSSRPNWHWRVAPVPSLMGPRYPRLRHARPFDAAGLDGDPLELGPAHYELDFDPDPAPSARSGRHPRASTAARPDDDSKREP